MSKQYKKIKGSKKDIQMITKNKQNNDIICNKSVHSKTKNEYRKNTKKQVGYYTRHS